MTLLTTELDLDPVFGPILRGAAAAQGRPIDRHGALVTGPARAPKGGTFLVWCGLLYRREQCAADRLCIPAGGGLRAHVPRDCHDSPIEGHFGRAKTGSLVRHLPLWVGQDVDVAEYVRSFQTCVRRRRRRARGHDVHLALLQVDVVPDHVKAGRGRRQPGDPITPNHTTARRSPPGPPCSVLARLLR